MRRWGQPIRHARGATTARLLLVGLAMLLPATGFGQNPVMSPDDLMKRLGVEKLTEGESSADHREAALRRIPAQKMTSFNRQRLDDVTSTISQYRKLPSMCYEVHPETYRYFIEHPDVAVSLWGVMGISKFTMWQTGPMEYEADTGDGSEGIADILYRDDNQTVALCSGTYSSPFLLKPLQASAVIHARYRVDRTDPGAPRIIQDLDVFISFPSQTVAAVAKMIAPITSGIMDRNVLELSMFARMMCQATQERPEWVCGMADQMKNVLPQRPEELKRLCESSFETRRSEADARVSEFLRSFERTDRSAVAAPSSADGSILYLSSAQIAAAMPVSKETSMSSDTADDESAGHESAAGDDSHDGPSTEVPPVPQSVLPAASNARPRRAAASSTDGWRATRRDRR